LTVPREMNSRSGPSCAPLSWERKSPTTSDSRPKWTTGTRPCPGVRHARFAMAKRGVWGPPGETPSARPKRASRLGPVACLLLANRRSPISFDRRPALLVAPVRPAWLLSTRTSRRPDLPLHAKQRVSPSQGIPRWASVLRERDPSVCQGSRATRRRYVKVSPGPVALVPTDVVTVTSTARPRRCDGGDLPR
jgi:hypothetical protein